MKNYFANKSLLQMPVKRAAYSDRTSYIMAEMSRLAYFKFEGGNHVDDIIEQLKSLLPPSEKRAALEAQIKSRILTADESESRAIFSKILEDSGFTLVETFNDPGTDAQAFLCLSKSQGIAILAFRGTEKNFKDIKTDVMAQLLTVEYKGSTIQIHKGYLEQFNALRVEIEAALNREEVKHAPLFITGHSLGGALAIVTVKFLASDIAGACYTFGSPPVGTADFDYDIKTPIYRIVNHVDIVPRLPSPYLVHFVRLLAFVFEIILMPLASWISHIKKWKCFKFLERFLIDAQKYRQSGYGSYLVGEGNDVRLRYSVNPFDLFMWWIKQLGNIGKGEFKLVSDHSIEIYSQKLATWAEQRK